MADREHEEGRREELGMLVSSSKSSPSSNRASSDAPPALPLYPSSAAAAWRKVMPASHSAGGGGVTGLKRSKSVAPRPEEPLPPACAVTADSPRKKSFWSFLHLSSSSSSSGSSSHHKGASSSSANGGAAAARRNRVGRVGLVGDDFSPNHWTPDYSQPRASSAAGRTILTQEVDDDLELLRQQNATSSTIVGKESEDCESDEC